MVFTHDTEIGLLAAAALVNSGHDEPDGLATTADLQRFVTRWGWSGRLVGDEAELAAVRDLRPVILELWVSDEEATVALVNRLLREADALPQLVKHDEWPWHLHATPADGPLAVRMVVEAAMAFVDVVRAGELDRLRVCAGENCENLVVDLSKNRSRRFCDGTCGNRSNVAAYRARRRGTGT